MYMDLKNHRRIKSAFANVNASQTGAQVVAGVAGRQIVVLSVTAVAGNAATDITFNSASTAISCKFANGAHGGVVLPHNPQGWFRTLPGEALTVTTGTGSATGVLVNYVEYNTHELI
jgi:hypothetical protein